MNKHEIGQDGSADKAEIGVRAVWVKPSLVRLNAADAEIGTRPNVSDGAFSVS